MLIQIFDFAPINTYGSLNELIVIGKDLIIDALFLISLLLVQHDMQSYIKLHYDYFISLHS